MLPIVFAICEAHQPGLRRVARNIARALHGIEQAVILLQLPFSSNDRTQAVVPTFSAVANGLIFESPIKQMQPPILPVDPPAVHRAH